MEREKCQITLDPAILTMEKRMRVANAVTGESDVLLLYIMAGHVVDIDTESRGGGANPLPSITLEDIDALKKYERKDGEERDKDAEKPKKKKSGNGNESRIKGTARLYLFLHLGHKRHWEKKSNVPQGEVSAFINDNKMEVEAAAHYAGAKTSVMAVLLPPCWIGAYYLRFRIDFEKPERLIKLFFDGLIDGRNTDAVLTATRQRIVEAGKFGRYATPPDGVHKALIEGFLEFSK